MKAYSLLPIRKKGKDSNNPNMRPTYAVHPHPPRTRGVISTSLEGSPPKPSTTPSASASLEGSEPTLGEADCLRLARG